MLTKKQQRTVVSIWNELDDESEDISTELLFAMTCERASKQLGVDVEVDDVTDALAAMGNL